MPPWRSKCSPIWGWTAWRADLLPAVYRDTVDLAFTTDGPPPDAANAPVAVPRAAVSVNGQPPRPFTVAARASPHVRHQHKHRASPLPPQRRFYFRGAGEPAATLEEFSSQVSHCDPAVLEYHPCRGDFSRWASGTLADRNLGGQLAAIERDLGQYHAAELERARHQVIRAIDARYPGTAKNPDGPGAATPPGR